MQAARCPVAAVSGRWSAGSTSRQRACALGQRGWNRQPAATFTGSGVSPRTAVMRHGRIIGRDPVAEIVSRPREEYTRDLVEAARLLTPETVTGASR